MLRTDLPFRRVWVVCTFALLGCSGSSGQGELHGQPYGGSNASNPAPIVPVAGSSSQQSSDSAVVQACAAVACNPGQRCDPNAGQARCVDKSCDELDCKAPESCQPHALGGHVCGEATCQSDLDCAAELHCEQGRCRGDACEAGARSCQGDKVLECSANGGAELEQFSCHSAAYFTSVCMAGSAGSAGCSCRDDWDCPSHTVCEAGRCEGTGKAPSCSLPPLPFSEIPPAIELHWGGDSRDNSLAHDGTAAKKPAPWSEFSHVTDTPVVANLDDDNGDGLINELDFPEILFIAHQGDNAFSNGVVRAIHGGGPKKGADYFARCADKLWTSSRPSGAGCGASEPDADSATSVAVGDLDGDGKPEIVYVTELDGSAKGKFRILDHTGALLYTLPDSMKFKLSDVGGNTPAIANLDFTGYAEIIIGNVVYVLSGDGLGGIVVTHVLTGTKAVGYNGTSTTSCPADVIPSRPGMELVAGGTLYGLPATLPSCAASPCQAALDVIWNAPDVAGNQGRVTGEGSCAVADIWGANRAVAPGPNNRPDGKPEVILIDSGDLTILDGATGAIIDDRDLGAGDFRGGAPNVDDFDGDGFMEVASALRDFYAVVDLQMSTGSGGACPEWPQVIARKDRAQGAHNPNPKRAPGGSCGTDSDCASGAVCNLAVGSCVCLHNGWKRDSDDDSSAATSSSVFDFNGDGAAEVLYNDECDFRVYEGRSGELLYSQPSRSRTVVENPVVADVDNDGNAEVVTVMNTTELNRCDDDVGGVPTGPNGVRVWGDPTDTWVAARRIWNQHSYHVTNVTESGSIPLHEPDSWAVWNGRTYNTYHSQPRSPGVAPDLTVAGIGISSPDVRCGTLSDSIDIAFEIKNAGDLRVGPGVVVRVFGLWGETEEPLKDGAGAVLERVVTQSLEPGRSVVLTVSFAKQNNGRSALPDRVRVVVDPSSAAQPWGAERECREDNNSRTTAVDAGALRADLSVELGPVQLTCPTATVMTTVHNLGSAEAPAALVRYYAGDPAQGGTAIHEQRLTAPVAAGASVTFTATLPELPARGAVTVYAVIDPDGSIEECNEANNRGVAPNAVSCLSGPD